MILRRAVAQNRWCVCSKIPAKLRLTFCKFTYPRAVQSLHYLSVCDSKKSYNNFFIFRWRKPVKIDKYNATVDATKFGSQCPQNSTAAYSEDCLNLNIYQPLIDSGFDVFFAFFKLIDTV